MTGPAPIDQLFHAMCEFGASDLHLCVGTPAMVRKDGLMQPLEAAAAALTGVDLAHLRAPQPRTPCLQFTEERLGVPSCPAVVGSHDRQPVIRTCMPIDGSQQDVDAAVLT